MSSRPLLWKRAEPLASEKIRHTSVVTTRSLFSMRGEWVTMKTSMLLRRGTSHVRVQKAASYREKGEPSHSHLLSALGPALAPSHTLILTLTPPLTTHHSTFTHRQP